jgi:acid phosphatase type 7
VILPANAVWKYPNVGGAMPNSWTNLTFDDSTWLSGAAQLGFNEGDEATLIPDRNQITYYFRRVFNIDDPGAFASLAIDMIRDDGGIIYINGTEVFRSPNLPARPTVIGFNTTTLSGQNGENNRDQATTIAPLVAGQNIAAVEMHQADVTSSDISFSLRLDGLPGPRLELRQFRGDWLLFWADPAFKLQQADTLDGTWTTLPTASPVQVDPSGMSRFYRLIR